MGKGSRKAVAVVEASMVPPASLFEKLPPLVLLHRRAEETRRWPDRLVGRSF